MPANRVTVRILGSGDAFGSGGRFHTSFFFDAPRSKLLIDFGASAITAMHRYRVDPLAVDAVVVSHLHGDHFGGLPFLLLDSEFRSRRRRPLIIAGPPGTRERLEAATETLYPGFWGRPRRYSLSFVDLEDGRSRSIARARVTAFSVVHDGGAPAFALRIACDGATFAYSGDTAWTERLIDVARGADLFLCEASSVRKPIPNHLTYQTVAANRDRFGALRIALTHVGDDVIARKRGLLIEVADDGQLFALPRRTRD
jgi:ribonuclease BN (tRNA processing enzyme)